MKNPIVAIARTVDRALFDCDEGAENRVNLGCALFLIGAALWALSVLL